MKGWCEVYRAGLVILIAYIKRNEKCRLVLYCWNKTFHLKQKINVILVSSNTFIVLVKYSESFLFLIFSSFSYFPTSSYNKSKKRNVACQLAELNEMYLKWTFLNGFS